VPSSGLLMAGRMGVALDGGLVSGGYGLDALGRAALAAAYSCAGAAGGPLAWSSDLNGLILRPVAVCPALRDGWQVANRLRCATETPLMLALGVGSHLVLARLAPESRMAS